MKRFWGHLWAGCMIAGIGGILLPACAHNDSSVYIRGVLSPPVAMAGVGCLYPVPSDSAVELFTGHFDVGLSSAYSPVVQVDNQLIAQGNPTDIRTETARVQLRGAVVRVTDGQGNPLPTIPAAAGSSFTSVTDGFIDPSAGTTPGVGQAEITIISPPVAAYLRSQLGNRMATTQVITNFKVFGVTLGGSYIESGEYQYVVNVCNGCLVDFPADSVAPNMANKPNCDAAFGASSVEVLPCVQGQETSIDCRLCKGLPACDPNNP